MPVLSSHFDPEGGRLKDQPVRVAMALDAAVRRAREDFDFFAELVGRDDQAAPIRQATIHRVWTRHFEACWKAGLHGAVFAPIDHGKTVQLALRASWEIGRNLNIRIKVVCNIDKNAKKRIVSIGKILNSPTYRLVFPWVVARPYVDLGPKVGRCRVGGTVTGAQMNMHAILVQRTSTSIDPTVEAAGVTTGGLGGRADLMLFDDCVDYTNAIGEPAMRDKVAQQIDEVWLSRLEDDGRAGLIGNLWHQADWHHRAMQNPSWCCLRQWVGDEFDRYEQEVFNPPADYPFPRF